MKNFLSHNYLHFWILPVLAEQWTNYLKYAEFMTSSLLSEEKGSQFNDMAS